MSWVTVTRLPTTIAVLLGCLASAIAAGTNETDRPSTLDPDFERFVIQKRALTKKLGEKKNVNVPPKVWEFFDAAQKGDWVATSNLFDQIEAGSYRMSDHPWLPQEIWGPNLEIWGAYEQFHSWDPKLLHRFGDKVITKITAGSIYFGGTDVGRFVISALCASQTEGRPFFTVTQNALVDISYIEYLREMYGADIYVPTTEDSTRAFEEYVADAEKRMKTKQLEEAETIEYVDGKVRVRGVTAVMKINEALTRVFIDKNPSREIYLEESFPLESLYGQSLPLGLIFKVNHRALEKLPQSVVEADHKFWTEECSALIGDAVQQAAGVSELCAWSERALTHPESGSFSGNPIYFKDPQAPQYYSQCRSAIAGYYQWWIKKSDRSQVPSLLKEADFAHRQAVALSPYNPIVVWRYADFLLRYERTNDAKLLVETTLRINPEKRMDVDSDRLKDALKKLRTQAAKFSAGK